MLRPHVDHQSLAAWVQAVLTCPVVLQGSYDQSRTKVLHMSMNPASAAKQRLREDQVRLQEECEQLRELVRALERGGPVPAGLEAAASLPSSTELTGRSAPPVRGPSRGQGAAGGPGTEHLAAAGHGRMAQGSGGETLSSPFSVYTCPINHE